MSTENALDQALASILTDVQQGASSAKDFILAEVPDVVQQLIIWTIASNALLAVVWGTVAVVTGRFLFKNFKDKESFMWDGFDISILGSFTGLFGVTAVIVTTCVAFTSTLTMLKAWVAPKLFIIEYAAKLM